MPISRRPNLPLLPRAIPESDRLTAIGTANLAALPARLEVLVWNIYKSRKLRWLDDFRRLVPKADLVLLQEAVIDPATAAAFEAPDGFEWHMAQSHASRRRSVPTGVKTGARVAPDRVLFYRSPVHEPVARTPKMILATRYPLAGLAAGLLVINVHAVNFVSAAKYRRQMNQVIEAIEAHDGPVILGGDFNSWSGRRRDALDEIIERLALAAVPLDGQPRLRHMGSHIDHIFYRGLRLESSRCLSGIKSSDHYPLWARFRLPES